MRCAPGLRHVLSSKLQSMVVAFIWSYTYFDTGNQLREVSKSPFLLYSAVVQGIRTTLMTGLLVAGGIWVGELTV